MLPGEIEPFAEALIEEQAHAHGVLNLLSLGREVSPEEIQKALKEMRNVQAGLYRFKVCMADEVKQKKRYEKYAKDHGYQYS